MPKDVFNKKGQSLIEVLVALAIFAMTVSAIFFLFVGGQSLSVDSEAHQSAIEYAAEGLEGVRTIRDREWAELADGVHGMAYDEIDAQWEFASTSDIRATFTRTVTIVSIDDNTKEITSTINWAVDEDRPQTLSLVEQMTNWENARTPGLSCGFTGDWSQPQLIGSTDLGPGREGTDIMINGTLIYISSTAASQSKPDFSVYDVSTPSSPQLMGEINVGDGIAEFFWSGNYVYAASAQDDKEFLVIDVSATTSPQEVASLDLDGNADATSITFWNSYAIVARKYSSSSHEIEIIDVSTPTAPFIASQLNMDTTILRVYAVDDKLYYSRYNQTEDVSIRDISNLPSSTYLGGWDIGNDDVRSLFKEDNTHFHLGGDWGQGYYYGAGSSDTDFGLYTFKTTGAVSIDVISSDNLTMVGTDNSNKEMQIIDVTSTETINEIASMNLSQVATGLICKDNFLYASIRSNDAVQIITSTP